MKEIVLGKTGIRVLQNGFGALPIQRVDIPDAVKLLQEAYEGGFRFFDTARDYTDSEIKLGIALEKYRDNIIIASKTHALTPEKFWEELNVTLNNLRTDHLDIYQFHCANKCFRPGDGTGMYETMLEAKNKGLIKHIGITAHKIGIAEEIVESDLYETIQFPFSYLASDREIELVRKCSEKGIGFIAMKGLSGGLLTNSKACMAFMTQFDNVLPIWGIQKQCELDEWLSYFDNTPEMDNEISEYIEKDKKSLLGDFCRGCGYCMPCTVGIVINQCARISQMIRRAPSQEWLSKKWQNEMNKINDCIGCQDCMTRCPYEINIPELLKKNLDDYNSILAGTTVID